MPDTNILFTADWHLDKQEIRKQKAERSLDQMGEYLVTNDIDYLVHSGDVWEDLQSFQKGSGVEIGHRYLKDFAKSVKYICIVKGNNHHDRPGSIALLNQMEPNILAYEYPAMLGFYKNNSVTDLLRVNWDDEAKRLYPRMDFIINLMPYPDKASLITDTSIDINNINYGEVFDGLMDVFGIINSRYLCPKVMGIHANIQGSRLSTGQTLNSQDIIISSHSLRRAKCNFIGAGHIHLEQEITPDIHYISSLYNCNHGEEEQKYFKVVKFRETSPDKWEREIEKIPFAAARPMVTVIAELKDGVISYNRETPDNAEVKVKLSIPENETGLLTKSRIEEIMKGKYGDDVKIDKIIVPVQRESRSEKIMEAASLADEVIEYGNVIKEEIPKSMLKKIAIIEAGEVETQTQIQIQDQVQVQVQVQENKLEEVEAESL